MNMRDVGNLDMVAKPKTAQDTETKSQILASGGAIAGFAVPEKNIGQMGIVDGMKVADFGAGSGGYTFLLSNQVGASGHVYAVEVQQDLLRRLKNEAERRGCKNVDIIWGDFEERNGSKIASDLLDVVLLSNTLFQLDDARGAVREALRVLKPGGSLVVIEWSDSFGGIGPEKSAIVTAETVRHMAQDIGFTSNREFEAGAHHYGLVFIKPRTPAV